MQPKHYTNDNQPRAGKVDSNMAAKVHKREERQWSKNQGKATHSTSVMVKSAHQGNKSKKLASGTEVIFYRLRCLGIVCRWVNRERSAAGSEARESRATDTAPSSHISKAPASEPEGPWFKNSQTHGRFLVKWNFTGLSRKVHWLFVGIAAAFVCNLF